MRSDDMPGTSGDSLASSRSASRRAARCASSSGMTGGSSRLVSPSSSALAVRRGRGSGKATVSSAHFSTGRFGSVESATAVRSISCSQAGNSLRLPGPPGTAAAIWCSTVLTGRWRTIVSWRKGRPSVA
jgi:hypothetical protein